jgi:tetratricopeptide (TPR) repeat protein
MYMATTEKEAARGFLKDFLREDMKKNKHQNKVLSGMASMYLNKLNGNVFQGKKGILQNNEKWNRRYKKLSEVPYIKESKEIAGMAVKKYMADDIEGAKRDFKRALKVNPGNIEAQISMCSINSAQRDFNEALKYCDIAVNMAESPEEHVIVLPGILADILFLRAEIYGNMKEYEKASLDLKKACKKAPADWQDFKKAQKKLENLKKFSKNPK